MVYNEYELIYLYKNDYNQKAFNLLAKKYENLIKSLIYEYRLLEISEDVFQLSLITLNHCVAKYDMTSKSPFLPYFLISLKRMCIRCKIKDIENQFLEYDDNFLYDDRLLLSDNARYYDFEGLELNKIEEDAMQEMLIEGVSADLFAKKHNMEVKQVYNLVYRLKSKLKKSIKFN